MARILHLLSDWKWTGPSEPALNLCCALRDKGHDVQLACQAPPRGDQQALPQEAVERGIDPIQSLRLKPSLNPKSFARDVKALRQLAVQRQFDVIHVHSDHDMLLARAALGGPKKRATALVRSYHKAEAPGRWVTSLHAWAVDGVVTVSQAQRERFIRSFRPDSVSQAFGAVDLTRFSPRPATDRGREVLGVKPEDVVVGIVARVQRHRRFDLFLAAMHIAVQREPRLKGVVLGRGTHREEVAIQPARRMGLAERVLFPGYVSGHDYLEALALFDFKVFLVPGSDGSCRAARELMAMGKPVVASRRRPLPEIVDHEINGLLVDESPPALAEAILRLSRSSQQRHDMGLRARQKAQAEFSMERELAAVESVYDAVASRRAI